MAALRHLRLWPIFVLAATLASCELEERFEPPDGPGPWVLVDLYHTRIQNPEDYRLVKGNYDYQGAHGYARAFDHLSARECHKTG